MTTLGPTEPDELAAMSADEHRQCSVDLYGVAMRWTGHPDSQLSLLARAQWHATMALLEQSRMVPSEATR